MKTVTMDWETYQKEIKHSKDAIEDAFEKGAIENNRRLYPIVKYCLDLVKTRPDLHFDLVQILRDAGEL